MAEKGKGPSKADLKAQRDSLKIESQIAEAAERAHSSASDYFKVKKQVAELSKEIRDLELEIASAEGEAKVKLQEELKLRQQLRDGLKSELKLVKAIGSEIRDKVVGALSQQTKHLSGALGMYYDIDESVRKTSMQLGLSAGRMDALSQRSQNVANHFASIGLSSTDAIEAQAAYNEEVGRTVMLSEQALNQVGDLAVTSGLGVGAISEMAAQMEQFGMGSTVALDYIGEIRDTSQAMGINSGKVLKKTQQNFKLLNKLNFKGGVKGLGKMAAFSEKFKISMEGVAASAEKVFSPEGAIDAAANLQMLGGGFSALADPFKLMFDARNDPQKYAEGIVDSLSGIAKFKDGEFIVSAYELQRLEQAGEALGFSKEEMAEMAKQKAKMDKIGGSLMGFDKDEQELLSGMIEFDKSGKALIDGKSLREMDKTQLKALLKQQETSEQQAKDAISAREQWKSITNQIQSTFLPVMKLLDGMLRGPLQSISKYVEESPKMAMALTAGAMIIGKAAEWYLKGYQLGLGFNLAVNKSGWMTKLKDKVKSIASKLNPFSKQSGTSGDIEGKANKTVGDAGKGSKANTGQSLKSLAGGLEAMGTGKVLAGALNLIPTSIGMIAMLPSIPTLMFLGNVKLKQLSTNLFEMALGLEFMSGKKVLAGAAIMSVAAVGFTLMTAGIAGMAAIALMGTAVGVGMKGLSSGLSAFGNIAGNPMVWLGVALLGALSLVFIGFSYGVKLVAEGIASVVSSFAEMFAQVSSDNIMSLLLLGPALLGISLGVMGLGASLLFLAATMAMGGWLGLLALGTAAESVGTAFQGIDANGITQSVDAINNVDMDKINALKELSTAMAVWGMFGSKPIKVEMEVDGQIKLGGANGETFDISELTPAQVSELKDLIFQKQKVDSTGGYV
jgi:hypothetical protein